MAHENLHASTHTAAEADPLAVPTSTSGVARVKQLIIDIEGRDLTAAAVAAVVVPPMDLT